MVYSFFQLQFWLSALLTPIAFFVSFYLPGSFFISRLKPKSSIIALLFSLVLGLALWGIQGYLFGYLHARWLTYLYLIFFSISFFLNTSNEKKYWQKIRQEIHAAYKPAFIFICLGTILQILSVIGSGMLYPQGVEFFFSNAVDGVMHLAYIESMARVFPPQEPSAAGMMLMNYHYWSDLVMAELVRVWHLPVSHLFFQFMPLFIAFLTGIATYVLVRVWKGTRQTGMWALFMLYFSADAAYLFTLILHQQLNFRTPAIDNGITQFLNIPHTFAKLVFLTGVIPFSYWLKTKQTRWLILSVTFFTTLAGFKIYFGMFAAVGVCLVILGQILYSMWHSKTSFLERVRNSIQEHRAALVCAVVFGLASALIYFPANRSSGGLFYSPLEWPKIFMGPDGLDFRQWWLRHQVYEAYHNTRNLIFLDFIAIVVCLISIYGTRLIGFFRWKRMIQYVGWETYLFFFPTMLLFTWLGLYTLQSSGLFNVFNFFAVAATGLSLFSAFLLNELATSKRKLSKLLVIIFIFLTLPRPIYEVYFAMNAYVTNHYDQIITKEEIEALTVIRKQTKPNTVVQSMITNETDQKTPYVSFFTDRSTYISGESLLTSHNRQIDDRIAGLKYIFGAQNSSELATRVKEKNIDVLYLIRNPENKGIFAYEIHDQDFQTLYKSGNIQVVKRVP